MAAEKRYDHISLPRCFLLGTPFSSLIGDGKRANLRLAASELCFDLSLFHSLMVLLLWRLRVSLEN